MEEMFLLNDEIYFCTNEKYGLKTFVDVSREYNFEIDGFLLLIVT